MSLEYHFLIVLYHTTRKYTIYDGIGVGIDYRVALLASFFYYQNQFLLTRSIELVK